MKVIAVAKKPISLIDPQTRMQISDDRPRVIAWTQFIETRVGKNEIKILETDLPNAASDDEFAEYVPESKSFEHAAAAYASNFREGEAPAKSVDRENLEERARKLDVQFKSNISDAKLAERVEAAAATEG